MWPPMTDETESVHRLRAGFDRFTPENIAANMPIVDLLKRVALAKSATPAQVALAWRWRRTRRLLRWLSRGR